MAILITVLFHKKLESFQSNTTLVITNGRRETSPQKVNQESTSESSKGRH